MPDSNALPFFIFYTVFLGVIIWFEGEIGVSILKNTPNLNPSVSISFFNGLMNMASSYPLLNIIFFTPFIVGLVWILLSFIP